MKITLTKTPLVVKKMFHDYIWEMPSDDKAIFLTFDDGPTPDITEWVLNTLKPYRAKATFFCIGDNVKKYPEIFKHVLDEGHTVGNHTNNHINGWKTKTKRYLENVLLAEDVISNQNLKPSINQQQSPVVQLFRPPYGQMKPKQGKKLIALGYRIVMWDVLSFDWDKTVSNQECLDRVISKSNSGSIIVFHDSVKASSNMTYALPKVLDFYSEKGFNFKAINL